MADSGSARTTTAKVDPKLQAAAQMAARKGGKK